jgi:hypothetical protein
MKCKHWNALAHVCECQGESEPEWKDGGSEMKEYIIPCSWKVRNNFRVKAESLEEAIRIAEEIDLPKGKYVDESFEVEESKIHIV